MSDTVPKVTAHCKAEGWFFETPNLQLGPYPTGALENSVQLKAISEQLGVESNHLNDAISQEYVREITISELSEILASTVRYDEAAKCITFTNMLLAQTDEDQFNCAYQGESSLGKSYIPLEIVSACSIGALRSHLRVGLT